MPHRKLLRARRFARSPKGQLSGYLLLLIAIAIPGEPVGRLALVAVAAVSGASLVDVIASRGLRGRWIPPSSAVLTALLCVLVIAPEAAWYVPLTAAAIGVASKHLARIRWNRRTVHVFNPAVAGLLATLVLFPAGESWWGALAERPSYAIVALLAIGGALDTRIQKAPQVIAYLATYYGLFTMLALATMGGGVVGLGTRLADVYRMPFVNVTAFVAFFMLTDPPTSPVRQEEQVAFGAIAGAAAFGAYLAMHKLAYPLVGLLIANAGLAWRRRVRPASASPSDECPAASDRPRASRLQSPLDLSTRRP